MQLCPFLQGGFEQKGYTYGSKSAAYVEVAAKVKVAEMTVRRWVQEFEAYNHIMESMRGKHSKTSSPILTDPEFRAKFIAHVREASRPQGIFIMTQQNIKKILLDFCIQFLSIIQTDFYVFSIQGGKNVTCVDLARWVNETLELDEDEGYTEGKL